MKRGTTTSSLMERETATCDRKTATDEQKMTGETKRKGEKRETVSQR